MLDTLRSITTPELIEVQLRPAGLLPRVLAWAIDMVIRSGIFMAASIVLGIFGGFGTGILLLLYFTLEWFYPVLFEVLLQGTTPGKRALGLAVVADDGTPVGWGKSMTRNLLRTADFLPALYGFGIISVLTHKEFRRLGDIVAGTLVVYRDSHPPLPALAEAEPMASPTPLDRETQRALVAFAERARSLTPARREELATLVPHLARAETGPQGVPRLLSLANYLIGRRA